MAEWVIIKPKGIGTVTLELEYNTVKLHNILFENIYYFPGAPNILISPQNGPMTEGRMKSEGMRPTSRLWANSPSLCGRTVNTEVPSFTLLDALSQIYS